MFWILHLSARKQPHIQITQTLNQSQTHTHKRLVIPGRPLLVLSLAAAFLAVLSAAVASLLAPLAALPALPLVLPLLVLVDDLHFQPAYVKRYGAEPEEGDGAHHGPVEQHSWRRQQHQPPQGEEAAHVGGAAEQHAHTAQDEEGWSRKKKKTDWCGIIVKTPLSVLTAPAE